MKNLKLAAQVVYELARCGVREFYLCAGARNAPLVKILGKAKGLKVHSGFEERSAAFFALGRIQATGRPVAVVTTSGTAVAELLPAVVEAHYSGWPLVMLTADRPRHFRGRGAPQAIEQVGLFTTYAHKSFDLEEGENFSLGGWPSGPVHVNVCFEEPLIDGEIPVVEVLAECTPSWTQLSDSPSLEEKNAMADFFADAQRPLVILGRLEVEERAAVKRWLVDSGLPVYAEGLSGLREDQNLSPQMFRSGEKVLCGLVAAFDSVIRIGGVPTLRLWRDLEDQLKNYPVLSVSARSFSGLGRDSLGPVSLSSFIQWQNENSPQMWQASGRLKEWLAWDRHQAARLEQLLDEYPLSEPSQVRWLSRKMSPQARVFVGNSLPVREWDLSADFASRDLEIGGNRGANGIDGQVSTFLGFCERDKENWCLLGDLTALYDLSGLWSAVSDPQLKFNLVVINNGGGRIFSRMFNDRLFENRHELRFKSWAELFSVSYQACNDARKLDRRNDISQIIELLPDEEQTQKFWQEYARLWK